MNENNDPKPEVNKRQNGRSAEPDTEQAAGTQRKPYENDAPDPTNEEPAAADDDMTVGQQNQPGLPDPEEKEWSPGSDAA